MAKKVKISYPNTQALLVDFAADAVRASKLNLGTKTIGKNKTYGVASRTLQKSLSFAVKPSKIEFFATPPADKYAVFIHQGVNGTRINRGSEFSYRDKQPPVEAIREWMRVKPIRLRDPNTGEFIKQTESKLNAAAFNIARSIKTKGIEGVPYFKLGTYEVYPKWQSKLMDAMEEDISVVVKKQLEKQK